MYVDKHGEGRQGWLSESFGTGKGTWRQDRRRTGETGLADQLPEKTGKAGSGARE